MEYQKKGFRISAAYTLIFINIIFYAIQIFLPSFTEQFILVSADAWSRPWTLITSMFLHGSPSHLLFNMYSLFMFGPLIESRIGTRRFVGAYFAAGLLAAISSVFFYDRVLGASGAIMGILGLTIMLLPDMRVLFFFILPMSMRTAGMIFAAIDIIGIFNPNSQIANIAHLGGLAMGLFYGWYLVKNSKKFQKTFVEKAIVTKPKGGRGDTSNIEMSEEDMQNYLKYGKL